MEKGGRNKGKRTAVSTQEDKMSESSGRPTKKSTVEKPATSKTGEKSPVETPTGSKAKKKTNRPVDSDESEPEVMSDRVSQLEFLMGKMIYKGKLQKEYKKRGPIGEPAYGTPRRGPGKRWPRSEPATEMPDDDDEYVCWPSTEPATEMSERQYRRWSTGEPAYEAASKRGLPEYGSMEEPERPKKGSTKRRPIREPAHEIPDEEMPGEPHYEEEYPEDSDNESYEDQSPTQKRKVPGLAQMFYSPRHKGQPLPEDIAESINYLLSHHLEEPTMDEIVNKYEIPQNCALLVVPALNGETWSYMGTAVRAQEIRLQRVLRLMGSSITAFARDLEDGNVTTSQ
ncbi:uncharacterized protein LOC129700413 [Leucoraja erinacea]|uniref:uncharacterized protein LOC129700413 n=1 Tax=Leucoraja erinaceus TaxID=7782 RepID=UPI002458DBC0|nr:uncharacterized protein LOC129700413 [Leucoraja erinacea]